MATAIPCLFASVLMFAEFGVLGCSALGSRRRSRFYLRLACACLVLLVLALGVAFVISSDALPQSGDGIAWMVLLLAALAAAPVFCYHTRASLRGSSDEDGGGGPGSGPPPSPPDPPLGGPPLPDAAPARARRRDHARPARPGIRRRGPAVEPARPRVPAGPARR